MFANDQERKLIQSYIDGAEDAHLNLEDAKAERYVAGLKAMRKLAIAAGRQPLAEHIYHHLCYLSHIEDPDV